MKSPAAGLFELAPQGAEGGGEGGGVGVCAKVALRCLDLPDDADDAHQADGYEDGSHGDPEDEVGAVRCWADLLQQRRR